MTWHPATVISSRGASGFRQSHPLERKLANDVTTLLVASTGGHLAELHDLLPRLGLCDDCVWATFDSPQSRSLLDGQEVIHLPPAATRDLGGALRDLLAARGLLRGGRFSRVVSTGASVAVSCFLPASRHGIACHYIESAARRKGPSLTGRLVARVPRTRLYTQSRRWAGGRWRYGGSVFDGYQASRLATHGRCPGWWSPSAPTSGSASPGCWPAC